MKDENEQSLDKNNQNVIDNSEIDYDEKIKNIFSAFRRMKMKNNI